MGIIMCIIPLMLTTGSFLPDLFITILSILFIAVSIKEKLWIYYKNNFFYFFIFFYFYFLLSSILSNNVYHSLESSLFYFRFGFFALAIWFLLDHDKNLLKKFTLVLLFTFLLILINGYYQFFFDYNIFGFESFSPNRLTLTFNDKMILGGYLIRLTPLLLGLLIITNLITNKLILPILILFALTFILIIISGERTALALLFLFWVMLIFFLSKFKILRLTTVILSFCLMLLTFTFYPKAAQRSIYDTMVQMNIQDNLSNIKYFSDTHQELAGTAINIFKEHKLIGSGPKQFRVLCDDKTYKAGVSGCSTHPHNIYLQLAAETGIIGILFLVTPLLFLVYKLLEHLYLKIRKKSIYFNDYEICILICISMTLWPIIPSNSFFNNWINIMYYLPIGFLLYTINNKNKVYE